MLYSFQCTCGRRLQFAREQLGAAVRCPDCQAALRLPALGLPAAGPRRVPTAAAAPRRSPGRSRVIPLAAVAAFLAAALGVGYVLLDRGAGDAGTAPEERTVAAPAGTPAPTPAKRVGAGPKPAPATAAATKPALVPGPRLPPEERPAPLRPAPRPAPPAPAVARTVPAEPEVGKDFTVFLSGAAPDGPWRYQLRTGASADWQAVTDGRVVLPALKPGPLTLHLRLMDDRGAASAALVQTWTPKPAAVPVTTPAPVATPGPGLKKGDRFYQEVTVARQSAYRVLGTEVRHQAQYAFVSGFEVEEAGEDGPRVVRQKVESARLDRAEPALRAQLNGLLQKTQGSTFKLTLGPGGEVVAIEGKPAPLAVVGAGGPGEMTFLMQSAMDLDGWKELGQLTFFRPQGKGEPWSRKMTHGWGPLGGWHGEARYAPAGKAGGLERYDYQLRLGYTPPQEGGGLPFQVAKADFRLQGGGGTISFDPTRGRTASAEERFQVRGALAIVVLRVTSVVEVEETQHFRVRILDRLPEQE